MENEYGLFNVDILSDQDSLNKYYTQYPNGLGIWDTYKTYSLEVHRISPFIKMMIHLRNLFKKTKIRIPKAGEEMKIVTAFGLTSQNLGSLPQILNPLSAEEVDCCNVVCAKDDYVYRALKPYAVNILHYLLIHTLDIDHSDSITLDVRCM